jgi:ubiquinone/menaquinone biosynthesis C-methylase UbiE
MDSFDWRFKPKGYTDMLSAKAGKNKPSPQEESEASRIKSIYERREARVSSESYSLLNPANLARILEVERQMALALNKNGIKALDGKKILEIGCGSGYWLRQFIQWGAQPHHVAGVDLSEDRIARARLLCPAAVQLQVIDARELEFPSASFDLVLQMTVFTSVLDFRVKQEIARQMLRVLKPDGLILWYDFFVDNPWNRDVRGVGKREIHALFPACRIHLERLTLVPPLGRCVARTSRSLYSCPSSLKALCSHYLGVIDRVRA